MNFYTTLITQTLAYLGCFLAPFFLLNFLTKGLIWNFLRVLSSRGTKVLIQISNPIEHYWINGIITGKDILYSDKETKKEKKPQKRLTLEDHNIVHRIMGVNAVIIDDTKNIFLTKDLTGVSGYNSERNENLVINAINKPKNEDDERREKYMFLIAIGSLLLVGFCSFMIYKLNTDITTLTQTINTIKELLPKGGGVI